MRNLKENLKIYFRQIRVRNKTLKYLRRIFRKRILLRCSDLKADDIILFQNLEYRFWMRVIKINSETQRVKCRRKQHTLWVNKIDFEQNTIFETYRKVKGNGVLYF